MYCVENNFDVLKCRYRSSLLLRCFLRRWTRNLIFYVWRRQLVYAIPCARKNVKRYARTIPRCASTRIVMVFSVRIDNSKIRWLIIILCLLDVPTVIRHQFICNRCSASHYSIQSTIWIIINFSIAKTRTITIVYYYTNTIQSAINVYVKCFSLFWTLKLIQT